MTDLPAEARTPAIVPHAPRSDGEPVRNTDASRESLIACAELLFFAYRDFTGDPDAVLAEYGFGRAHHRVLHFVHRNPGLRVADLLDILKITKQSLARVLKQLIDEGFVTQRTSADDGRERLLNVTGKGAQLTERLTDLQVKRIEMALSNAGMQAGAAFRRFLFEMIAQGDRAHVQSVIGQALAGRT